MLRVRLALCGLVFGAVAGVSTLAATQATQLPENSIPPFLPNGREFVIRLRPAAAATECEFRHYQSGAFGGRSSFGARALGAGAYGVATGVDDKPARALKVVVWCRGAALALVDVPVLDQSGYARTVELQPLKPISLTGRVGSIDSRRQC